MPQPPDNPTEPTLGVREPRKPTPPALTGGAAAPLTFEQDETQEAEGRCVTSGVTG